MYFAISSYYCLSLRLAFCSRERAMIEGNYSASLTQSVPFVDGWDVVQRLGEGAYGDVKLLHNVRSGDLCALKIVQLKEWKDGELKMKKEVQILKMLKHENIIKYYADRVDGDTFYLFLEYADGGELFDRIEPEEGMPERLAHFFFRQLIDGLEYMHSVGICHRDIKPENLLLTKEDVLKISDLGMATIFRHKGITRKSNSRCGTLQYAAPEVFSAKEYDPEMSDIWSCGVVLVTLLVGELPWDSPLKKCSDFLDWVSGKSLDRSPWDRIGFLPLSLLKQLLAVNPTERATMEKIKNHLWFKKGVGSGRNGHKRARLSGKENSSNSIEMISASQPTYSREICETSPQKGKEVDPVTPTKESFSRKRKLGTDSGIDCGSIPANKVGFSQPIDIESLLMPGGSQMTQTQQSQNLNPMQRLVRRMTRFCVTVTGTVAFQRVLQACTDLHCTVKKLRIKHQIAVTTTDRRNDVLKFQVIVYEMGEKVLVDFRRSKGDGLEIKFLYKDFKKKLNDIVCTDSVDWLAQNGLITKMDVVGTQLRKLTIDYDDF